MKWVGLLACLLLAQLSQPAQPDADSRIERIVASVSQQRLQSIVTKLAGFGTRNTLSDVNSTTRGIGAEGQESLISAYVSPVRAVPEVKIDR